MKKVISKAASLLFAGVAGGAASYGWSTLDTASDTTRIGPLVETAFDGGERPESVRMLLAIGNHERLSPTMGWFGPGSSARSWEWLAERCGVDPGGAIAREKFAGPAGWFDVLDRDRDGSIERADLEWSADSGFAAADVPVEVKFQHMQAAASLGMEPPTTETMLRAFFDGELGSMNEGPPVGGTAPDFTLAAEDGSGPVRLYDALGEKPVVLVFGSLTCNGFRGRFDQLDEVYERFAKDATFLFVYVREAHPAGGWELEQNVLDGISVPAGTTAEGRAAAAGQCRARLKPSMPLLIDAQGDPTAEAYSAPPSRIYVLDRDGKVAYKSGRGPFGFKPGEAEQALVLTLLDQADS